MKQRAAGAQEAVPECPEWPAPGVVCSPVIQKTRIEVIDVLVVADKEQGRRGMLENLVVMQ